MKLTANFFPDPILSEAIVSGYMKEGRHEEAVEYLREFGSATNKRFDSQAFLSTYVNLCVRSGLSSASDYPLSSWGYSTDQSKF